VSLTDPDDVRSQYASEVNLETRRSVWQPGPSGVDPLDVVVDAVRTALPAHRGMPDVLEVGCGTGAFAARLVEELPGVALLAVDQSPRFVELTRERGVPAGRARTPAT
jgi:methylase of polypeptide subunit release factors